MTAAEETAYAVAESLIRRHLWRGERPRPGWHIGRDLSIWRRLVRLGVDPVELNGAIAVMPEVAPYVRCMLLLASDQSGPPLLERAAHRWHALTARDASRLAWGMTTKAAPSVGLGRVSITPPPE